MTVVGSTGFLGESMGSGTGWQGSELSDLIYKAPHLETISILSRATESAGIWPNFVTHASERQ